MTTATALIADGPSKAFRTGTIDRREPGPHDVVIDIKFAGICHSDIHQAREEWGEAIFPMVPGHEIAGVVRSVGSDVTGILAGQHAGVGCFVDSCRECENCRGGDENHCLKGCVGTYNARFYDGEPTYGGYSTSIVVDENYVLAIPESIELAGAAPLLCAGITLFTPLKHWNAGPGKKVAIVGMGGLGHMGVKLAAAMGAEVTVLSQSLSKQDDGRRFGATDYRATSDPATFTELANTFDLIVNTVSANLDLDAYLGLLRLNGVMVNVGLPSSPDTVSAFTLVGMRRSLAGSNNGNIADTQDMLDFCGEHGLAADVEVITADQVDEAYERVIASDVRYRFVIDIASLPEPADA